MKKQFLAIFIILLFGISLSVWLTVFPKKTQEITTIESKTEQGTVAGESVSSETEKPKVTLVVDFGEGRVATQTDVLAENALEVLENVISEKGWEYKIQKYDFGSMVEEIEGHSNTNDKSWIYFVNGQSGDKAADQFELQNDDLIEWKYIKPEF